MKLEELDLERITSKLRNKVNNLDNKGFLIIRREHLIKGSIIRTADVVILRHHLESEREMSKVYEKIFQNLKIGGLMVELIKRGSLKSFINKRVRNVPTNFDFDGGNWAVKKVSNNCLDIINLD